MLKKILPALISALVAAALGFGASRLTPARAGATPATDAGHAASAAASPHAVPAAGHAPPAKGGPALQTLVELPPLVVGLTAPAGMWVRFEGAAMVEPMEPKAAQDLRARLGDDFLAYFAGLSLPDLEGVVGLKAVRADLVERARLRSDGKVRDIALQTLVVQ